MPRLYLMETADERGRAALAYGEQIVSAASAPDDLMRLRRFSDWLVQQPPSVQGRFDADLSGAVSEDEAPVAGTCTAKALRDVRKRFPSADTAVAERAGRLYDVYITQAPEHRRAEEAWVTCMANRGFAQVGSPLKVWRPDLEEQLAEAQTLGPAQTTRLARALTRQAVAEHQCAIGTLDDVTRAGELQVVHALAEEFPQYAKRADRVSGGRFRAEQGRSETDPRARR